MNTVKNEAGNRGDKRELVPSATINGRIVGDENGKIYNVPFFLPFLSPPVNSVLF